MSELKQRVHFIAIGGSAMHNLALTLHQQGNIVTGSDDFMADPAKSRLEKAGLLPESTGWFPEKINTQINAVILGVKAKKDNPELLKAQELGLKIYSFPEYIYTQSIDKQRVVIAGSHGKTTITAMIVHVLKHFNKKFDYILRAPLEGFDSLVGLNPDSPVIIIEGDEYPSSVLDKNAKFLNYHHHIGLVSGVAWDHIDVYPTIDEYVKQFDAFADASPKGGMLIYCEDEDLAALICDKEREDVQRIEYSSHKFDVQKDTTYLNTDFGKIPVSFFGKHNMRNLSGAKAVCLKLGVTEEMFYQAIPSFKGANSRLETLEKNTETIVFKDFVYAPFRLKASTNAVKKQFGKKELVAVLELHTYSSLNKEYLSQYKDTFKYADVSVVYYNPSNLAYKKLDSISAEEIKKAFNNSNLQIFTDSLALKNFLINTNWKNKNLLLMSSGDFGGLNLPELAKEVVNR